jgi:KUP system potassium uptake protein
MASQAANHHSNQLSKISIAGLLVTLGIIYGDIGTSPLYVFKSIIGDRKITEELVYGGISCVIWTLTLQTTFKYVLLTLRADNRGEGGIFSLFALVRRYAKWLYIPAIIGAATLLADGIITPPISVSSAIEGLNGVHGLENTIVPGNTLTIGIVIGIISFLFFFQRFGTKVVGFAFGPIMFVWFSMIMLLGLIQIVHNPGILKAISPYYGIELLFNYPHGFWLLGAVFLCTTGAEALYSDLGHCGRKNIQTSWIFVKAALIFNYMGQGAWLLAQGSDTLGSNINPFYELMPHWFLLVGVVIATFATIIASQALISGSFTLISEAISMNFWPRVTIKFPTDVKGQIYIPSLNFILWIGCVSTMLYFKQSSQMEAAYGFSIVIAMLMTTSLMYVYMHFVKRWNNTIVFFVMSVFIVVELSFFVANIAKLKQSWMFLLFGAGSLIFIMMIWYRARKITNRYLYFVKMRDYLQSLIDLCADKEVPKYATHLVYLTKADIPGDIEKRIIDSIINRKPKRADVYWFVHIDRADNPYEMEYSVNELSHNKVIRVNFKLGFRVQPRINLLFKMVMQEMKKNKELEFLNKYENLDQNDFHTDITYVVIETFLSIENELTLREGFIMDSYFAIKRLAQSDQKAFGLDNAVTLTERVPLLISPRSYLPLKRVVGG